MITKRANFINLADLIRGGFAGEKAKQMMGAGNPLVGDTTRAPGSTACPSCGRWHRQGNVCPGAMKALDPSAINNQALPPTLSPASLLNAPTVPPPTPTHDENVEDLNNTSSYFQNQNTAYVQALLNWYSKYCG